MQRRQWLKQVAILSGVAFLDVLPGCNDESPPVPIMPPVMPLDGDGDDDDDKNEHDNDDDRNEGRHRERREHNEHERD